MLAAFAVWLHIVSLASQLETAVFVTALAISAGFAFWGCLGSGQAEPNRFGAPAAA
jgi:hypothetical protein